MGLTTTKRNANGIRTLGDGANFGHGLDRIDLYGDNGFTSLGYSGENMHHQVFIRPTDVAGADVEWNLQVSADGTNFIDLFDGYVAPPIVFQTGATNNPPYPFVRIKAVSAADATPAAAADVTIDVVSYGTEIR